jgi:hypothetical protein
MQLGKFLPTFGLFSALALALAVLGGGCGPGSGATDTAKADQIRESKKSSHQQARASAKKLQEDLRKQQGVQRRGSRRGAG